MKKIIKYLTLLLVLTFAFTLNVKAATKSIYVNLETLEYSSDEKNYKSITEYNSLEEFLIDYNSNNLPDIYITNFLFDGVSSV